MGKEYYNYGNESFGINESDRYSRGVSVVAEQKRQYRYWYQTL